MGNIWGTLYPGGAGEGGDGGTGTLLVGTVTDLGNIVDPVEGQQVAVQETATLWKYEPTNPLANPDGWVNTSVSFQNFYGGGYANASIEVAKQFTKTNQELIELFGVRSPTTVTVDQSAVTYESEGSYPVTFSFTVGQPLTLTLKVIPVFNFETRSVKDYAVKMTDLQETFDALASACDLTNYVVLNNDAPPPAVVGDRHEWNGVDPTLLRTVQVVFNNAAVLPNGKVVKIVLENVRGKIYGVPDTNQSLGFDFSGGKLQIIQRNYSAITGKFTFYDQLTGSGIELDQIRLLFSNVQAAKIVGTDYQEAQVFVDSQTLLSTEEELHPDTDIPVVLFSLDTYDPALDNDDKVKVLLAKHNSASILVTIGKNYTGNRTTPFSSLSWESTGVDLRIDKLDLAREKEFIEVIDSANYPVASGNFTVLHTFPVGTFTDGRKYEIKARADYTRTAGNNDTSIIRFRLVQGAPNVFDGPVSVSRDNTSATLGIPQLPSQYQLNSTQVALLEAYVPPGEPAVTINGFSISFTEV